MKSINKIFISFVFAIVFSTVAVSTPFVPYAVAEAATVALSKTALTVYIGDTDTLTVNGTTKSVKWSSSDKTVATVSTKGLVSGVNKGTTTITALVQSKKYTCKVTVKSPSISNTSLTMEKSDQETLSIKGALGKVTWKSSNTSVASVNSKGKVVAVSVGTAKITGQYNKKSYVCKVTVLQGKIHANTTNINLSADTTVTITVDDLQKGENLQYEIKDLSIVDVEVGEWSGNTIPLKIIPLKKGATTITVTTDCKADNLVINVTVADVKSNTGTNELTAEEVYSLCSPSYVQVNTNEGLGSGFFIDDYTIVTNYHVIEGAKSIKIQLLSGETCEISSVLGYSKELDIAVLKVPVTRTPIVVNTHGVRSGETVYAIGSSQGLTNTFTNGIVTNVSRVIENVDYIQTNAAITNGNSGGPLLNAYGEVIGINSMGYIEGQNLNFAINIEQYSKVSQATPIAASDFYKQSGTGSISENNIIYEDETASGSMSTAQMLTNEVTVTGTTQKNGIDYYKFTLTSSKQVSVLATNMSDSNVDIGRFYVGIVDANDNIVAYTTMQFDEDFIYLYANETLSAGTYYVIVFSDTDLYVSDIPYVFALYMD